MRRRTAAGPSRLRHIVLTVAFLAGALGIAEPNEPAGLDGTSWQLSLSPDRIAQEKGIKEFPETLSFSSGKIATGTGEKQGFLAATYNKSRSGDSGWSFTADQTSTSDGSYSWSGTVRGNEIRGILVWTKPDRSVLTYTFRGAKRKNE